MKAIETTLDRSLPDAEQAVRDALSSEGFGVLTEIDVAATLWKKLGVRRPPLKILGACSPELAHRALEIEPLLALLLPCNVVLEDAGEGRTKVTIADPRALLTAAGEGSEQELHALGEIAAAALERAVGRLGS